MNLWDVLILLAVLSVLALAFRSARKSRKKGCSCGCGSCPVPSCPHRNPPADPQSSSPSE